MIDIARSPLSAILLPAVFVFSFATIASSAEPPPLPPGEAPSPTPVSRLAAAGTAADYAGSDCVVVFEEDVNRVKPSGVTYVDGYRLVKVLTAAGCRDLSVLTWGYDPQSSYVEVREVSVLRGAERIAVDVGLVQDLPAPQMAIYWSDRIKVLQLPRLQIGDGIEVTTFRKGFTYALLAGDGDATAGNATAGTDIPDDDRYIPPMPGEYFDIVLFAAEAPIVEKRYVLRLPADKRLHAETYNGALYSSTTYDAEHTEYAWWCLDMPARIHEPSQPGASDLVPKVVLATVESWEAKSRWFFDVNRNQFEVTPAIQAKVDEILDEADLAGADDDAKAEVLLHWVAQNIRYSGQTMGPGEGFILHPGSMIFEQRSGVCKDIAGMLVTMMRAAGLDAYAAMTLAGERIDAVPADQFNHCVTALRLPDGSYRMYDPTWVPYNNDIWSLLEAEQHYLVGSPAGEPLSRIRYSPPTESPLIARHEAELDKDGNLTGTFRFDGTGAVDGRLRRLVSGVRKAELAERCAELLAPAGASIEIDRVRHHQPGDFSEDMWLEIDYRLPNFATDLGETREFTSPLLGVIMNDGSLFRTGKRHWPKERETDVMLWFTQKIDARETIKLPRGLKLQSEPAIAPVDEIYAACSGSAEMDGRDLIITQQTEVRRRQIPPGSYAGFHQAMTAARDWSERVFRIGKEGES